MLNGSLPWEKIDRKNLDESVNRIGEIKKNLTSNKLCEKVPKELY